MPTRGQASLLHSNINTYIGLLFVATFSFGVWLIVWHAFFGTNPVENLLLSTSVAQYNSY